jgi:hypothetical protein
LRTGDPLAVFLAARPDWKEVYGDGVSLIVVRNESAARPQSFRQR